MTLFHRTVTLCGDTAGSRGVCSLLLESSKKTRTRIYRCLKNAVIFVIPDESSPLLNRLISFFKVNRLFHRVVTLHGDTAGSRGVCSLLLDSSRKTRTRIYGRLIEAVSLWSLINPHLFSIDWFPSFNSAGWFIEWSLFMETQLGPGESALCCCSGLQHTHTAVTQTNDGVMMYHCWALRWTTVTDREILFLPLSFAPAAMFPRQSGFRGRTPLLSLLIHSRLEKKSSVPYGKKL